MTLQDAKDQVARLRGYSAWSDMDPYIQSDLVDEVAELYATSREQAGFEAAREIKILGDGHQYPTFTDYKNRKQ